MKSVSFFVFFVITSKITFLTNVQHAFLVTDLIVSIQAAGLVLMHFVLFQVLFVAQTQPSYLSLYYSKIHQKYLHTALSTFPYYRTV